MTWTKMYVQKWDNCVIQFYLCICYVQHEDDAVLLSKISDIFHALFITYRENALPYFEALLPQITRLLVKHIRRLSIFCIIQHLISFFSQDSRMPVPERQWGICFYDDAIEFGGVVRKIKIKIPFITFFVELWFSRARWSTCPLSCNRWSRHSAIRHLSWDRRPPTGSVSWACWVATCTLRLVLVSFQYQLDFLCHFMNLVTK